MITYFTARRAERVFTEYKGMVMKYWRAQPEDYRTWMSADAPAPENEKSIVLREQIIGLFPEANTCAASLGLNVTWHSYPAPMIGGPVIPVNLLYGAIDRDQGHARLSQQDVLDGINRCLATATALRKKLFWAQLLNPIWWIIEIVAYILRIPFAILRRAGLPATVEESIWGHIVKVLILIALIAASIHWSINVSARDLIHLVR